MIEIRRTNSEDPDFIEPVKHLDKDLAERDGDEHAFYAKFNKTNLIKHTLVAYEDGKVVGCGAIREYEPDTMEVKRMYVFPEKRGKGIAGEILAKLEEWTNELGYKKCILETGKKQPEAIALYTKHGYKVIPSYGQYKNVENSVCFGKEL